MKATKKPTKKAAKPRKRTTALMLRTCNANMTSYNGFRWPKRGPVECDDWDPIPECGHGLHGLLWGEGHGSLLNWDPSAVWLAVEIDPATAVDIGGKIKVPRGIVRCCGDRETATRYIAEHGGAGRSIVGGTSTSGVGGTSTSGDWGTSTSGDWGTSTSGVGGTSTSGDWGTSTSGDGGTSTSGVGGTSTSGDWGRIHLTRWDGTRRRTVVLYVGEDGIKAHTRYRLDEAGKPVEVTE